MKTYSCRVALGMNIGTINPHHEVTKVNVPRAEIVLLRAIHGKDAVLDLKETGVSSLPDSQIYATLAETYPKYVKMIESLFNVKLLDLSSDLDRMAGLDEGLDEEHVSDEPVPRETLHLPTKNVEIPSFTKQSERTAIS